jgi:hypothetical protein
MPFDVNGLHHSLRHSMPPLSSSSPFIPLVMLSIPSSSSSTFYFLWSSTTFSD